MKKNLNVNVSRKMAKKMAVRKDRHSIKAELRRQPRVSEEALKDWAMNKVFRVYDKWVIEAFDAQVTPIPKKWGKMGKYNAITEDYDIWVGVDAYDPTIPYWAFDVEEDLEEYWERFWISREDAINLGLVE